jgi:hypothetical protein
MSDAVAQSREIVVGGETVAVREYTAEQVFGPVGEDTAHVRSFLANCQAAGVRVDMLYLVGKCGPQIRNLAAAACGRPVEWFNALPGYEATALALAAWEVNIGFFVRALAGVLSVVEIAAGPADPSPPPT